MLIIMIRTVILYIVIILMMRLMGKKQLGELQPSELVTTILISNVATLSIEDPTVPMFIGVLPIFMIVCIDVIMSGVMLKSPKIRTLMAGHPKVVISEGTIDQKTLADLRYTIDDVLAAMREQGIFDPADVRYAIVETTGKIHFYKMSDGDTDPPSVVIKDGERIQGGMDDKTLSEVLASRRISADEVFLLTVGKDGTLNVIRKDKDL